MRVLFALGLTALATPALAAGGEEYGFFSLKNTDFIVLIGFLLFIGILVYFKVPAILSKMLDDRADRIRADLDEAKALREEAQTLLASYERKHKDVQEQADRIVESAKRDAEQAAEQAKADIQGSVARRLAAAQEQIASARAAAVKDVRDEAVTVAIGAARAILAGQMDAGRQDALIDAAIDEAGQKLH